MRETPFTARRRGAHLNSNKNVTTQVALNETDVGAGFIPARFTGTGLRHAIVASDYAKALRRDGDTATQAGGHKALPYTFAHRVARPEQLPKNEIRNRMHE
ncbi:MAG: hypothetical protein HY360_07485 [Verrucomicrobia bacterium]|nr:hypothetical protein [Verrucomicrobiota bacterium]